MSYDGDDNLVAHVHIRNRNVTYVRYLNTNNGIMRWCVGMCSCTCIQQNNTMSSKSPKDIHICCFYFLDQ